MEITEIKQIMNQNVELICRELLPGGKRDGKNWVCGDINGNPGKSFKVGLKGQQSGVFKDFAGDEKGDLITLWKQVRGLTLVDTLAEVKSFLKINDPMAHEYHKKVYKRPPASQNKRSNAVVSYLTNERKLTVETLKVFRVESDGEFYFLPSYRGDELIHWKKISINPDDKGKKKVFTAPETEPCLFGWQAMDPDSTEVFICEGEIDAMTLHQYGASALSVPFGAGVGEKLRWIETEYANLERFEEIFICMDADDVGQSCVSEIISRLGSHRCKVVVLPMKDPNECLKSGMKPEEFSQKLKFEEFKPEKLRNNREYLSQVLEAFNGYGQVEPGQRLALTKNGEFKFRNSEITLWTGINGHGKSLLLGQVILDLISAGEKVAVASMEMRPKRLLYRMIRQATGMREPSSSYIQAAFEWMSDSFWIYDHLGSADVDNLMESFVYARKRYGVSHFVIDSLMKCGMATDDYNKQKFFVDRLCTFKDRFNCHVHLVAHNRKVVNEFTMPDKMDVSGSVDITNLVDNQILVFRDKKKEAESRKEDPKESILAGPDGYLNIQKQRNGEWEGILPIWYDNESYQYRNSEYLSTKRYVEFENGV